MHKTLGGVVILLCAACADAQEPGGRGRLAPRPSAGGVAFGQPTWEYAVHTRPELERLAGGDVAGGLNKLGEDGWELVSVDPGVASPAVARQPTFYFKRARRDGFARMFGGGPGLPDGVGRGGAAAPAGGRTSAGFGGGAAVGPAGGRREGGVGSARGAEPTEAESTQILALKHARADQLERILRQIYGQRGQARLAVDPRTNSLIVAGTEKQLVEVAALVSRLDQPAPEQQNP